MRRISVLAGLFGIAFSGFLCANIPLSFAMKISGAKAGGLNWQEARGTMWNGALSGVAFQGRQSLGTIGLKAKPLAFLRGQVGYEFDWQSLAGQGAGNIFWGFGTIRVSDLDLRLQLAALADLRPDVRDTNSSVIIENASVSLKDQNCSTAAGALSSDVLAKLALRFNASATELTGNINCNDGDVQVLMQGQLGQSDVVTGDARVRLNSASSFKAHVQTNDVALGLGLAQYGFTEDATGYVFQQEAILLEGL